MRRAGSATQAALRQLRDVCAENGIELQVVLLPELHELQDYPFANEHAVVASYLRSIGVPVLDLAADFKDETDPMRLWVAPDDAHPNALANQLIADHAEDFIAQRTGARPPVGACLGAPVPTKAVVPSMTQCAITGRPRRSLRRAATGQRLLRRFGEIVPAPHRILRRGTSTMPSRTFCMSG